jgi:hypothetical protein
MRGMTIGRACVALALSALPATLAAEEPAVRVGLTVTGDERPRGAMRQAIEEADAIWRPFGVSVTALPRGAGPGMHDVRLTVQLVERLDPGQGPSLGGITFLGDEGPEPVLRLATATLERMLTGLRLSGRPFEDLPPAIAHGVYGRALGRVLAHELGHFLLSSRAHRDTGVMRAAFSVADLTGPSRRAFALDRVDLPRLKVRLSRLATALPPVLAGGSAPP